MGLTLTWSSFFFFFWYKDLKLGVEKTVDDSKLYPSKYRYTFLGRVYFLKIITSAYPNTRFWIKRLATLVSSIITKKETTVWSDIYVHGFRVCLHDCIPMMVGWVIFYLGFWGTQSSQYHCKLPTNWVLTADWWGFDREWLDPAHESLAHVLDLRCPWHNLCKCSDPKNKRLILLNGMVHTCNSKYRFFGPYILRNDPSLGLKGTSTAYWYLRL